MCGIVGFTTFCKPRKEGEVLIRGMAGLLEPRGPDAEGFYVDSHITLGHKRLSIIDLEGGIQPMGIENGRYQIVYNGEIYNYIELREELQSKGRVFSTQSDTEVILHQFAVDGVECLHRFNGMFAFALWDRDERRVFFARDRIGIKPLYYCIRDRELIFASELKALLPYPSVSRDIDFLSLSKYLTFSYIPAPHTIFKNIHKLEPATYALFDKNSLTKKRYWDIPIRDNPVRSQTSDECAADILELLGDSVAKRLRSDVPVGVFLSGGIDSSTLTALACKTSGKKIHTFSVGFEESSYDESAYAKQVSELYDTEHHHEVLSLRNAVEMLPRVMSILDEPFGDSSILPTYLLSQFTSEHVKVVLGGEGGDELFAGYPSFLAHQIMERLSILPPTWRDGLIRLAKKIPVSHRYASAGFLIQQFFKGAGISSEIRFLIWMGAFGNEGKQQLLSGDIKNVLSMQNTYEDVINYVRQSGLLSDFERLLYLCMKLYLQDGVLVKVDRASMANSLEVRVPFLDHSLVEYVSQISSAYKLKGWTSKYILKKAVKGLLPKKIIQRRKAGFSIPTGLWLKKDLRSMLEDLCSESAIKRDGWFDYRSVRRLMDDHFADRRDNRKELWTLLSLMIWRENYYEKN